MYIRRMTQLTSSEHTPGMASRTLVAVHEVHDGMTGARVGSGSLVDPLLVLVHPPLDRRLADQSAAVEGGEQAPSTTRLRLAVGWLDEDDDGTVLEVIDVHEVLVAEDSSELLVCLDLERASAAPLEALHGGDGDPGEAARALLRGLASVGAAPPGTASDDASTTGRPHAFRAAAARVDTELGGHPIGGEQGEVEPADPPPSQPPVPIPRQLWCRAFPGWRRCRS